LIGSRAPRRLAALRLLPLAVLALASLGCGDDPADAPAAAAPGAAGSKQGVLHLVTLNRLQGYGEDVPCVPGSLPVLPAAAELRDRLRAGGDHALLVALGDSINRSYRIPHSKAAEIALLARSDVALQALDAAGVDAYVPAHGDLGTGFDALLDRCATAGVPVLLSNVLAPAHPNLKPWLVVEAGTLRIGLLGLIPAKVGDAEDAVDEEDPEAELLSPAYPGASILAGKETTARLIAELRGQHHVDLVVVLSGLSQKANSRLARLGGVDVVIGTSETGMDAGRIIIDGATALMSSLSAGREVGHTTIAVRNGSLALTDMSPLHSLPGQIAATQAQLDEYARHFGTSDPVALARIVAPGDEQAFLNMVQLLAENRDALELHRNWSGSYIDHRAAELLAPRADHPALAALARQGPAIEAALAGSGLKPATPPEGRPAIPVPQDCQSCHAAQYAFWAATPHADAYATLQARGRQHDVTCLECHAAGWEDDAGWADPRFDAPFGGVTCYQCHAVYAPHAATPRQVVDPQFVHADPERMDCADCHIERRSPGFDKDALLPAVACPPMRGDEPTLLLARQAALEVLRSRRSRGLAEPRDEYLEGRALVGLGQFEEGYAILDRHARTQPDDAAMRLETARLFEQTGNSAGALALLRDFLDHHSGEPLVNEAYVTLLLEARDQSVRDAELALSHLSFLLPEDLAEARRSYLGFRVLQVDALYATNRIAEGLALLNQLASEHADDPRVAARIKRYTGRAPDDAGR
jgi:hypothetical protein